MAATIAAQKAPSFSSRLSFARRPLVVLPLLIICCVIFCGMFAGWITPHRPDEANALLRLRPPAWEQGGSWSYPLGTDPVGRDILSRIMVGARTSVVVALTVVLVSGCIGSLIALVAGYFQGVADAILMRFTDAIISMPFLVIAVAVAGVLGSNLRNLILVLAFLSWSSYARILRGEVLRIKQADFVTMARITGVPWWRILSRHIVPSLMNTLIVLATLQLGITIIAAASLDFLGLGIPPPTASWGGMLSDGRQYIASAWWVVTWPGVAIAVTVLATNFLGDWVRVQLDPKQ